ncbi:MAG: M20/M25/M40 family metallo-hydrolase [Patescibacteria group bacterium]|nr:M20/M25/M40 family metallo-hydrolase [Patescibacteria group bacterium]
MIHKNRAWKPSLLLLLPLAAALAVSLPLRGWAVEAERNASLRAALESIRASALQANVDYLADDQLGGRLPGTEGSLLAGEYLRERLETLKLEPGGPDGSYFQPVATNYRNVLARIEGRDPAARHEVILLGAHYDHVGLGTRRTSRGEIGKIHNGADDNASGCSTMLEVAAALKSLPEPPRRSVVFAFWDAEELGFFGSKHWRDHPTVPLENVAASVTLDMVGRLRNDELFVFGSRTAPGFRRFLAGQNEELGLQIRFPWDVKANSDHYMIFERQIPILLLHTGLHDDYHTPRDIAAHIDSDGMQRVARYTFRLVYELAEQTERFPFREASRSESEWVRSRRFGGAPELPDRLGAGWEKQPAAEGGMRVDRVRFEGPAHQGGLRAGDRILQFAGRTIESADDLTGAVLTAEKPAEVVVARRGETEPVRLTIAIDGRPWRLGVTWRRDDAEPGATVLTYVAPGTPAARAGLQAGDRVMQAGGQEVGDDDAFVAQIAEAADSIELLIERDGQFQIITVHFIPRELRRAA